MPALQGASLTNPAITDHLWGPGHCKLGLNRLCFIILYPMSLVVQMVKNPPAVQETWVQSQGWEDPLEEGMATHSSIFAWRIPMDRGAWLHRVAKSQTRLSNEAQHSTSHVEVSSIRLWASPKKSIAFSIFPQWSWYQGWVPKAGLWKDVMMWWIDWLLLPGKIHRLLLPSL